MKPVSATLIALLCCAATSADQAATVGEILEATGVRGGLVVHLGCGEGKLTAALRVGESCLVHGLDASSENVDRARAHIRSLGLYGPVSVEHWQGDYLPYADNLVNLVVAESLGKLPMAEVMRVLVPLGLAYVKGTDGRWQKTAKSWPKEIDAWTHYQHGPDNNAVARDARVPLPQPLRDSAMSTARSTISNSRAIIGNTAERAPATAATAWLADPRQRGERVE